MICVRARRAGEGCWGQVGEVIRVSLAQDNGTRQTSFAVEQIGGVQSTMFARPGLDRYILK